MRADPKLTSRLKSLELQGYKTFATKTLFEFAPTITAIVGPNGSGKSNIADAIRWVLGEQSYSLLRGKRTEDMIFAGSEARPRAGMASATITFDNSQNWLPIDFTEVSIGRRASRDGQNEYIINGQRVRLRDVSELLSESGLAERTYTIIGQGLVDAALSLRADERRNLFEEAAGIGLYRSRREEAVRRLEMTRRNLDRVQDILTELRPRLRSLERQAQRARDYLQVKDDLHTALKTWYGYHWDRMQSVIRHARREADLQAHRRDELRDDGVQISHELIEIRGKLQALRAAVHELTQASTQLFQQRESLGRRVAVARERARWLEEQRDLIRSEMASVETVVDKLRQRLEEARTDLNAKQAQLERAEVAHGKATPPPTEEVGPTSSGEVEHQREELRRLAAERAGRSARLDQLVERAQDLEHRIQAQSGELESVEAELAEARRAESSARQRLVEVEKSFEATSDQLEDAERRSTELEDELRAAENAGRERRSQVARVEARLQALSEEGQTRQGLAQRLVGASRRGELTGLIGRLDESVRLNPEHAVALRAALGEALYGLTFQSRRQVVDALAFLERSDASGSAVLLPKSGGSKSTRLGAPQVDGVVGNAADLIGAPGELRPLIESLLGRTIVVENRQVALLLMEALPRDAQLVTHAGEIFAGDGRVILGTRLESIAERRKALASQLEAQSAELRRMEAESTQLQGDLTELRQAVGKLRAAREALLDRRAAEQRQVEKAGFQRAEIEARRESLGRQLEGWQGELQAMRHRVESERAEVVEMDAEWSRAAADLERAESRLQSAAPDLQRTRLEARWQLAKQAAEEARQRVIDLEDRLDGQAAELAGWRQRLEDNAGKRRQIQQEIQAAEAESVQLEASIEEHRANQDAAESALHDAEAVRSELENKESQARLRLQDAEGAHSEAQIEMARREEELLGLQRRIEDDFGLVAYQYDEAATGQEPLPLKGIVERLPAVDNLPEGLEAQVQRLRGQLRRMGSVNPEAQEEYREVRERTEFLTSQVDDLRRAESQMQEVIAELDVIMEREFRRTFEAVAGEFRTAFARLFGGGSARLVLTDPDHPNESGIDIEARLPGKREQGLAVLSGGERSLAASALIFALLKVSPTPFCVLDEVDAMLDESNVRRFCDLLEELSENTQFVLITHNRETVQVAEAVYGVSMGADSASRVISLDLEATAQEVAA